MIYRLLQNPYYHSGSVICRLATNFASGLWAILAFARPGAANNSAYIELLHIFPEWAIAGALLFLSLAQTAWLAFHWPPIRFGAIGYGVMCAWWTMVLVLIAYAPGPIRAAPIACVSTVVVLAAFGFVSNPKGGKRNGLTD